MGISRPYVAGLLDGRRVEGIDFQSSWSRMMSGFSEDVDMRDMEGIKVGTVVY